MKKINKSKWLYILPILPFLLLIIAFELVPIGIIIFKSFLPEGGELGFTLEHYTSIFTKKLYQQALLNSIFISVASSVIGIFIAFFGAKAMREVPQQEQTFFMGILNMCSNFTGIPLAFSYIVLFGNVGVFVLFGKTFGIDFLAEFPLYSVWGLLLTYIYFQIPLATLLLIPAFEGLHKEWREAVQLLGGSHVQYWIKVGIPMLLPSILGTFGVLFANALAAYATAYALLQNNLSLLPIRISEQFVGDVMQRQEFGSALAVILMVLMVGAIFMNQYITKHHLKRGGV